VHIRALVDFVSFISAPFDRALDGKYEEHDIASSQTVNAGVQVNTCGNEIAHKPQVKADNQLAVITDNTGNSYDGADCS
jgi:hypothetical protein